MKAKNLYKINCLIESFDTNDKDKAVYYKLNLYSSLSKSSWTVERRYQDFHNYHSILSKNFFHLPEIPSKTLTRLTSMEDLAIRKELLEAFCQRCLSRSDLISNMATYHFFDLKEHYADFKLFQPYSLFEINSNEMEISCLDFSPLGSLLFVGKANRSITGKINGLVTKVSSFLGGMSNPRKTKAGGISIYNMIQSNSGEVHLERVHEKFLFSGTCVLKFKKEISTLLVGTTCGEIHIFKIYIREKAHIARELVEQIGLIKAHQARIVGLDVDTKTGYIFSTAAEGQLVISEQNYQCIIKKIEISKTRLTTLTFLEEEKLLITTDEKGSMWFLDVSSALNPTVIQGIHGQLHGVSSVKVIRESSVILVGTMVGEVQVFKMDITDRSNIRIKKELEGCTSGSEQVRQVYLTSRNELIAAFSNGSLCIYGKNLEFPEFTVPFHSKDLTGFYYIENRHIMITGSADHTILIYQLPLYFPSELIRGDRSVDRISLLSDGAKEKFSQGDLLEDYDEEPLTASLPNEKVEKREDQYSKVQSLVEKSSRKLNSMGRLVLQEFEKECEDINGWDV